jgi:archaeosortase B (VPXXXP-CTERM-specific)
LGQGKKPEGVKEGIQKGGSFRREFLLFLSLFFALWLLSYILTRRYPGVIEWMINLVAREVAFCMKRLGYRFEFQEPATLRFLTGRGFEKLVVIAECTGVYTTIIYFSIIGAYPARISEKLIGLVIGVPSIHVLNLARMVFIAVVLNHRRDLFDFFHGYLWQVSFVIFMLLLVIFWMGKIVGRKSGSDALPADETNS